MPSLIPAGRRFYLRTFGCQMNRHDSERIAGMLKARGWRPARNEEDADLILLNTCSVRRHAEERVLGRLARYRREKEKRPRLAVGVLGCMAQIRGETLREQFPELDLILGPGSFGRLPEEAEAVLAGAGPRLAAGFDPPDAFFRGLCLRENSLCGWVTVMRGCDNFCSYCVVPFARGREVSRSPDEIVEEIRTLGEGGYREVTLLGQNVNSYRGIDPAGAAVTFPGLLRRVNAVPGIERIRFLTSHPKDIFPSLIEAIGELDKVCESLHFPAQSGSDAILEKMNRGYTRDEYLAKARRLKEAVPGISLASDFIVGFPGETGDDFSRTLDLHREVRFDRIFAFAYSPRPRTAAAGFPDDVPPEVKASRLQELFALQRTISLEKNRELAGSAVEVLVEGRNRRYPDRGEGRTRGGQMVFFPWEEGMEGRMIKVLIDRVTDLSLFGRAIE
ncbi:MAG: tRNA (N6-isopentenyl adenosine(37)-C2)-methylthiotransferase MiaB [PVC group bacterium]